MLSFPEIPDGFNRDIRLLTSSMFVRRIMVGFMMVVRAIYFSIIGYSPVEIGLLLSIAAFISAIRHITFGYLCDRYGRKPFLIIGSIFATLRVAIFAISTDFWMLALAQGLGAMGEGAGAGQPVVSGYITDKTEAHQRPSIYSGMAITNSLASTIGYALGGAPQFLQNNYGLDLLIAYKYLWWASTAIALFSIVFLIPLKESERVTKTQVKEKAKRQVKSWGIIMKFSLVRATSGLGWGLIESLMSLYIYMRFGVDTDVLGPIYAFARLITTFSYMLIPYFTFRFGDMNIIIASRFLSAIVTTALGLSPWYNLTIILLVINRIIVQFTMPIRQTFASGMVDPEETATAIGISNSARMGLRTIAPTLAGYMFESISLSMPFLTGAALMAINGVLYKIYFTEKSE